MSEDASLSLKVEPSFPMDQRGSAFFEQCSKYARQLGAILGNGVSVRFYSKGVRPPMASFRYHGAEMGRIALEGGRAVIPHTHKAGWDGKKVAVSPRNAWQGLFRPHLSDLIEKGEVRLEKLRVASDRDGLPGLAEGS